MKENQIQLELVKKKFILKLFDSYIWRENKWNEFEKTYKNNLFTLNLFFIFIYFFSFLLFLFIFFSSHFPSIFSKSNIPVDPYFSYASPFNNDLLFIYLVKNMIFKKLGFVIYFCFNFKGKNKQNKKKKKKT